LGSADKEAEHPQDQPDHEQDPEDVKRGRDEPAATEEQQQQDEDDLRNHLVSPPRAGLAGPS